MARYKPPYAPLASGVYAYYNEIDPYCVKWLRNLIRAGELPKGDVDSRSIKDVRPDDLKGYTQCHFFAGIGGWPLALRLAGWPDDREIWTGSCPCQPFSVAGKGGGTLDERHLWPDFFRLIRECRPDAVWGEQVGLQPGYDWLNGVAADLEAEAYRVEAVDIPAASVNAPHRRNRIYWKASNERMGVTKSKRRTEEGKDSNRPREWATGTGENCGRVADPDNAEWRTEEPGRDDDDRGETGWDESDGDAKKCSGGVGRMADSDNTQLEKREGKRRDARQERKAVERSGGEDRRLGGRRE